MTDKLKEPATTALLQRSKKLRGEMDGSMARLDRQCVTVMFQMEEALQKVLAERDALALDAARYRWLRKHDGSFVYRDIRCFVEVPMGPCPPELNEVDGSKLDSAIDAAMKGQTND